jgi:hypothetical protein
MIENWRMVSCGLGLLMFLWTGWMFYEDGRKDRDSLWPVLVMAAGFILWGFGRGWF